MERILQPRAELADSNQTLLIIVGSNVMVSDTSEGFPYLGKNDVFLLGIITGYYIGYAYNSKYFNLYLIYLFI